MIQTVLMDLDDTIFDFLRCEREALAASLRDFGIPPEDAVLSAYSAINLAQWKLLEQGKITRDALSVRRFAILAERFGLSFSPEAMTAHYDARLAESCFLADGAADVLADLSRHYALYAATNGSAHIQHSRIKRSGIGRFLSDVFISEEIGANKPEAAFFARCFAEIPEFNRQTAVMVGDSLTSDIRGGKNAGLQTVWLCHDSQEQPDSDNTPDAVIHSLTELPTILEKM